MSVFARNEPRVLLVGGGAREHAIAEALHRSGASIYACLPNKNPGILSLAKEHLIVKDADAAAIAAQARAWGVEYAVVGPDGALAAGVTDALAAAGVKVAAPTKAAAEIEWNKAFMRDLLERHRISGRVRYELHRSEAGLREAIARMWPLAVKPLGLTGGKGVKVSGDHVADVDEALAYAKECLKDGTVLLEEKVEGEEFSLMAFCDGTNCVPMPAVQDHKRAFEGDQGPNTGGMGSYSDAGGLLPFVTKADLDKGVLILHEILAAMRKEGRPFVGTIYGQFMLSRDGPRVIEINARFGDPEAMNVLTLLESSYLDAVKGMAAGKLDPSKVRFSTKATVCKYVVPEGYGVRSMAGQPLAVDEKAIAAGGARCYYAAIDQTGGERGARVEATTTTSRSVGIVGIGATLAEANAAADSALAHVTGPHLYVRRDIGTPALLAKRVETMRRVRGQ
ncbi:MAG TPA: phosphoribosylamine--glycine ligase [Candidatus Thermoplasmatota archaeon]|nr:phosphoribosylamine--glycine ligase [Candidatus Thermoplasmatota archaeon]